jgi:hypothetical protein
LIARRTVPIEQLRLDNFIQARLDGSPNKESDAMFPICQRILLLHLSGNIIRTAPDHPFFTNNGWVEAGEKNKGVRLGFWANSVSLNFLELCAWNER